MTRPHRRKGNQIDRLSDHAEIVLQDGSRAKVDLLDLPLVEPYTWRSKHRPGRQAVYAYTHLKVPGAGETGTAGLGRGRGYVSIAMHQLLLGAGLGGNKVDHKNEDGLDNRRANLRLIPNGTNIARSPRLSPRNTTGYRGVAPEGLRFSATCGSVRLGRFNTPEEAARVYDAEARRLYGADAFQNFPLHTSAPPTKEG